MRFFWEHKLLTLLLAACVFYWVRNPPRKFGMYRKNFVIYSKLPITFWDVYVDEDGKATLLDGVDNANTQKKWYQDIQQLTRIPEERMGEAPILLVGEGFAEQGGFKLASLYSQPLQELGFIIKYMSSPEAIEYYNELRDQDKPVVILLEVNR
ncbi:MAG: hypothetical protein GF398_14475 [Chitinivibrionales bacterium]|nr:hypothetical protein [Chitinivibrionales bacterium]